MSRFTLYSSVILAAGCIAGAMSLHLRAAEPSEKTVAGERFFEQRTYTATDGKLDALHARFRDHTNALFLKHGMTPIGYWTPTVEPKRNNTLIYILAYPSQEAREKSWKDFQADPDWIKAKAESEKAGKLVDHVDSVYMTPTNWSPMK